MAVLVHVPGNRIRRANTVVVRLPRGRPRWSQAQTAPKRHQGMSGHLAGEAGRSPGFSTLAKEPRVHHGVLMSNHSPAVQHVIDCRASLHDLEDLTLNHDHGVQKAAAVCCACNVKQKGNLLYANILPLSTASQAVCQQVCVDGICGICVRARGGVHVVDFVGFAHCHVSLAVLKGVRRHLRSSQVLGSAHEAGPRVLRKAAAGGCRIISIGIGGVHVGL